MTMFGAWGRRVPPHMHGKIRTTWGARAIFERQQIDLLWDRQSWFVPDEAIVDEAARHLAHAVDIQRLADWVNAKGLPYLRREVKRLEPSSSQVLVMEEGCFHIEASPQSSYGYLYIRAWEALPPCKPTTSPEGELRNDE